MQVLSFPLQCGALSPLSLFSPLSFDEFNIQNFADISSNRQHLSANSFASQENPGDASQIK